ncbi:YbhB/YbcL family Raf kinase inhibitor-like protein [Amycolatopsis sp. WQ 127309]|uniref:YbhB/YbcL family Raf kinase inhibitor-like protein n=1 Tax=Amycolatopsis sp. WQ 127309 TaxID=2932773 RepID=UPI001FF61BDB|nr:YbhB/YbcL family Raf kinase inhibitor-like protein [Amycolatopsis sp. WQ 127309]UOZ02855.1 YbhB/YbcL family Raf kinase inhibitor-like protein [Amycolatopsis sp. WQ 127309]
MHPVEALLVPVGRLLRNRRPDEAASIANAPGLATGNRITLTSPAFRDGEVVPAAHCGQFIGADVSPALTWSALPEGTQGLVLVLEDLDSPGAAPGIHTIAAFAPLDGGLPEGALTPADPRFRFVPNHRRQAKYVGPRPLPGHGTHRYRFHLYALDAAVDFTGVADAQAVPAALAGHVLASGTLTGTRTT